MISCIILVLRTKIFSLFTLKQLKKTTQIMKQLNLHNSTHKIIEKNNSNYVNLLSKQYTQTID